MPKPMIYLGWCQCIQLQLISQCTSLCMQLISVGWSHGVSKMQLTSILEEEGQILEGELRHARRFPVHGALED